MVKHQKEKLYQSAREHRSLSHTRHGRSEHGVSGTVHKLPFDCCALTLTQYESPVCTPDGVIFESKAILPYIIKNKTNPVSGEFMTTRDIITLHMDKDENTGSWQCPVMQKPFSNHSKVVAIRQNNGNEANVFSYEAVEELNFKPRNFVDLISGEKFSKTKDVIFIFDPSNDVLNQKREEACLRSQQLKELQDGNTVDGNRDIRHSVTSQSIMDKLAKKQSVNDNKNRGDTESETSMVERGKKLKLFHSSEPFSDAQSAYGSLTSTFMSAFGPGHESEVSNKATRQAQFDAMKRNMKKGYVNIHTNKGTLLLELHCDIAPRTSSNFLGLAQERKYDGSMFHRSIRNFMVQCGKPANGKGEGRSFWGEPFEDEFDNRLKHNQRGVISMANSGLNSNGSQFFITYKSCTHLYQKHSIFGQVIEGLEVLQAMEEVPVDKNDQPTEELKIVKIEILYNPIQDAIEAQQLRKHKSDEERRRLQETQRASALGQEKIAEASHHKKDGAFIAQPESCALQVGKYLQRAEMSKPDLKGEKKSFGSNPDAASELGAVAVARLPLPPKKTVFRNFSEW